MLLALVVGDGDRLLPMLSGENPNQNELVAGQEDFAALLASLTAVPTAPTPATAPTAMPDRQPLRPNGNPLPVLRTPITPTTATTPLVTADPGGPAPKPLTAPTDLKPPAPVVTRADQMATLDVEAPLTVEPRLAPIRITRHEREPVVVAPAKRELTQNAPRPDRTPSAPAPPDPPTPPRVAPIINDVRALAPVTQDAAPQSLPQPTTPAVMAFTAPPPAAPGPEVAAAAPRSYVLEAPVNDAQWNEQLGQRLIWMSERGIGRAELRLNPPELGPVEVRVSIANDEARVAFQVQHAAARDALESAMPRLREMFSSQGLTLSDANVSEQPAGNERQAEHSAGDSEPLASRHGDDGIATDEQETDAADLPPARVVESLIDTYA